VAIRVELPNSDLSATSTQVLIVMAVIERAESSTGDERVCAGNARSWFGGPMPDGLHPWFPAL
jgi:hypothetical protein